MKTDKVGNYFLGLDIGTNSVGWAATDENYDLLKYKNHSMWGVHLFDEGTDSKERRAHRTARRRLQRRKQRIALLQDLFKEEISKVDPRFYIRLKESALLREDKTDKNNTNTLFNDLGFTDKEFHKKYPTIHHLISAQIDGEEQSLGDIRLVYLSCAWLLKNRGHFLNDLDVDNVDKLNDFNELYSNFEAFFESNGYDIPWHSSPDAIKDILKNVRGVKRKVEALEKLLFNGERAAKYDKIPDEDKIKMPYKRSGIIGILSGGKKTYKDLFYSENEDKKELKIELSSEDLDSVINALDDDGGLIIALKAMYDWSQLCEILGEEKYISKAKTSIYEKHASDLKKFKKFVLTNYDTGLYNKIFKENNPNNYSAYVGKNNTDKKSKQQDFYDFLKKLLEVKDGQFKKYDSFDNNGQEYAKILIYEIETKQFLPKQVVSDNRVIPYQLYYRELDVILSNASKKYSFLNICDEYGTIKDKVLSIMKFRVPYFIGPLNNHSKFAWIVRKAGQITPWNFKDIVDEDASEKAFIDNMTNKCTYLPEENVLPRYSLVYSKFTVLNEINNITISGERISPNVKQRIYHDICCKKRKVTKKQIHSYLVNLNLIDEAVEIEGIDDILTSNNKSYFDFKDYLDANVLTEDEVENIIEMRTYTEDNSRFKNWLKNNYPKLSEDIIKIISKFKYDGFGRFSKRLLKGIEFSVNNDSRERSLMTHLWETNYNFMELMSDNFEFITKIKEIRKEYYGNKEFSLANCMEERYISNAVKRQIYRTYEVVKDIVNTNGEAPKKIFIEMARGGKEDEKNKRKVSRYDALKELFKCIKKEEPELNAELDNIGDPSRLDSKSLYLYFTQLGRCPYCGKRLNINNLHKECNIDHIIPQCLRKDDSLHNNLVLCCSTCNGNKSDTYPISNVPNVLGTFWTREQRNTFWLSIKERGLITSEKYNRLVRTNNLTQEELDGFINRQLVETRQGTKIIADIFQQVFPKTEIVYVKAGTVSEFRHEYDIIKVRSINDLHHAKDAYLNIVVGNVYHEEFTKKYYLKRTNYSLKTKTLFGWDVPSAGWYGSQGYVAKVVDLCSKNDIFLTKYALCKKGKLFDQQIVKAAPDKIPVKGRGAFFDTSKYGGYNKSSASFFILVKCKIGKKKELTLMPFDLMYKSLITKGENSTDLLDYVHSTLIRIWENPISEIEFPLGLREIKINSVFSLDGLLVTISGKANGGQIIGLSSFSSAKYDSLDNERFQVKSEGTIGNDESQKTDSFFVFKYLKIIEKCIEKKIQNDENLLYKGISKDSNNIMYECLVREYEKIKLTPGFSNADISCKTKKDAFLCLGLKEQIETLTTLVSMLKTNRKGAIDLSNLGLGKKVATCCLSAKLTNWNYSEVYILDQSPAGLHTKRSVNLKTLLD